MAIRIDPEITARQLLAHAERVFAVSAGKILDLDRTWDARQGAPVFTVNGRYAGRGWTEWTQGFQFGSAILQYDATGDGAFLELGRSQTVERMAAHVSHFGVHDHGFNNISTYGNLLRLLREGRTPHQEHERRGYELALKISGAVQAARWSRTADGGGFIYSFNGAHSLFIDTLRSLRSLAVAHQLGHVLLGEQDIRISLLGRLLAHAQTTARHNVFYGKGRDAYDVPGRVAHESVFNPANGQYRCPNSQQGYSPFTTWTRGLAWAILGFAEQLEFLRTIRDEELARHFSSHDNDALPRGRGRPGQELRSELVLAAQCTADYYLQTACADGIPMWDTGAPQLRHLPSDYLDRPADPFNAWEPVDSSAAAIAAQGLLRLGNYLRQDAKSRRGRRYRQAAMTVARTLFSEPYLSTASRHQGLLLHSVYHRPNGWDHIARGQKIPNGESSMWGDYHLRELALLLQREARSQPYPAFFL